MSFKYPIEIGFFGVAEESGEKRELEVDECLALFNEFCRTAPESTTCQITPRQGNQLIQLIGRCDGENWILRRGMMSCVFMPYECRASILTFAAFVTAKIGCSIYSEYDNGFLSFNDILQMRALPDEFREFLASL
jgi:hypothetical protein